MTEPRKRGMGAGGWILLLGLGGCTAGACYAAPHIGWVGWLVIGFFLFVWPPNRN